MSTSTKTASTPTEGNVEEQLAQLRADLSSLAESVGHEAKGQLRKAQAAATENIGELEGHVRRNPLAATAIAAGIGFLIGAIVSR